MDSHQTQCRCVISQRGVKHHLCSLVRASAETSKAELPLCRPPLTKGSNICHASQLWACGLSASLWSWKFHRVSCFLRCNTTSPRDRTGKEQGIVCDTSNELHKQSGPTQGGGLRDQQCFIAQWSNARLTKRKSGHCRSPGRNTGDTRHREPRSRDLAVCSCLLRIGSAVIDSLS